MIQPKKPRFNPEANTSDRTVQNHSGRGCIEAEVVVENETPVFRTSAQVGGVARGKGGVA